MGFLDRTPERTNPEVRYGPCAVTHEYLREMRAYLAEFKPQDRNDPEGFAVINYLEDLLAEVERLRKDVA